ncbi:MAG: tRNA (N6-threonylcarbamoyladenosine(37)-N6)-methyltransferase TrmO [Gammaproteobacteria bacterium]|nr:tRNA (N6-threonylcarbamoyladenosine(37)-N6)-methyltransferase TrmO [Gammaproteobacteria bacterium]
MNSTDEGKLIPIGYIRSPYKEKFAIPRQPGLVTSAISELHLVHPFNDPNAVRGLEQFSHLWVIFEFHQNKQQEWSPLIRPPRLGGNTKIGVFASRSSFRPNNIGMSAVKLKSICTKNSQIIIEIYGGDFVDGTPILDIKPYVPYSDSIPDAAASYAIKPDNLNVEVEFTQESLETLNIVAADIPNIQSTITQVLIQDPRPGYRRHSEELKTYGMTLYNYNIQFKFISANLVQVLAISKIENPEF